MGARGGNGRSTIYILYTGLSCSCSVIKNWRIVVSSWSSIHILHTFVHWELKAFALGSCKSCNSASAAHSVEWVCRRGLPAIPSKLLQDWFDWTITQKRMSGKQRVSSFITWMMIHVGRRGMMQGVGLYHKYVWEWVVLVKWSGTLWPQHTRMHFISELLMMLLGPEDLPNIVGR